MRPRNSLVRCLWPTRTLELCTDHSTLGSPAGDAEEDHLLSDRRTLRLDGAILSIAVLFVRMPIAEHGEAGVALKRKDEGDDCDANSPGQQVQGHADPHEVQVAVPAHLID